MLEKNDAPAGPWYKEFWAWFVFAPLIIVVIACSITVTLAFKNRDSVVKGDYYKIGKMINSEFKADQTAKELGLIAKLNFDLSAGTVRSTLSESEWVSDDILVLSLSHPVNEQLDHFITLKRVDALLWQAPLSNEINGRWYVKLAAIDDFGAEFWRLQGEIDLPQSEPTILN